MAFTHDERTTMQVDGDAYLAASIVIDLLLDVRNDSRSPVERDAIDRDLVQVRNRHLIAASEVRRMLDELDQLAGAPTARRLKRRFGH